MVAGSNIIGRKLVACQEFIEKPDSYSVLSTWFGFDRLLVWFDPDYPVA